MKDLQNHVKAIIKGLDSGEFEQYGKHPSFQDHIDTVAEVLEDPSYGEDVLMAYLKFWEESNASVEAGEIPRNLSGYYRGNYNSPGAFLRAQAEDFASGKETGFLRKYGEWIDWEGMAASPDASDFTFIELENYYGVYVFRK